MKALKKVSNILCVLGLCTLMGGDFLCMGW